MIGSSGVNVSGAAGRLLGHEGRVRCSVRGCPEKVAGRGITVNNVQPGPIDTDFESRAGSGRASEAATALDGYGHVDEWPRWWRSSPVRSPRNIYRRDLTSTAG